MAGLALVQTVGQPVDRLRCLAVARKDGFERLDFGRLGRAGQCAVGRVGIDDPALAVGHQRAVLVSVEKGTGEFVGARLRHHLDEADHRGDEEENSDHGQHAGECRGRSDFPADP